tara:strand:+ start:280 stop:477 length:198 start_codon:yes stop_codon:yes gene_type:complete
MVHAIEKVDKVKVIVTGTMGNGAEEGCMLCPKEYPLEFKDLLSYREYKITGTCQKCQDIVFRKGN